MNFFGKDKKQDKLFVEIKNSFELIYWIVADLDHFVESYPEKINKKLLSLIFDNINKFNNFFNETLTKAESLSGIHKDCTNLIKDYTKLSLEQFDFTKISNSSLEEKNDIQFLRLINEEAKFRDLYLDYLQKTDIEFYRIHSYQYYSKALLAMMHFNAYLQDNHDNELANGENDQIISCLKRAESILKRGTSIMDADDASLKDLIVANQKCSKQISQEFFELQREYNLVYKEILFIQKFFYSQFNGNQLPENSEIELVDFETTKYYGKLNEIGFSISKLVLDIMDVNSPEFNLLNKSFFNNQFDFIKVNQR